jgi:hypothetical protein
MPAVVNRPLESRTVSEFLRSAAQRPSGLVIEGEPGIAKTTLWLSAAEQAIDSGYRVFAARVGPDRVGTRLCGGGRRSPRR